MSEDQNDKVLEIFKKYYEESKNTNKSEIDSASKGNYMGAFIRTITESISEFKGNTLEGLFSTIRETAEQLLKSIVSKNIIPKTRTILSLKAESELIIYLLHKYASKRAGEECSVIRSRLVQTTKLLYDNSIQAKDKIYKLFASSLKNNITILVHGYSSTIAYTLIQARKAGKRFKVLVSNAQPSNAGKIMFDELNKNDIEAKLIYDSSIGYYMKDVSYVVVGADVVCENGGVVNKVGTYTISIVANNFKKPVYVLCDSLKFIKMYPINQVDVQESLRNYSLQSEEGEDIICDYTPPEFITLFFTNIGILTPSAVSDEFIKIYYT